MIIIRKKGEPRPAKRIRRTEDIKQGTEAFKYANLSTKKERGYRTFHVLYDPLTGAEHYSSQDLEKVHKIAKACSPTLRIRSYTEDRELMDKQLSEIRAEKQYQFTGPTRPAVSPRTTEGRRSGGVMIFHPRQSQCSTISNESRYA